MADSGKQNLMKQGVLGQQEPTFLFQGFGMIFIGAVLDVCNVYGF